MAFSSETNSSQYNGNGSTTAFATGFFFLENTHIKVTVTSSSGVDSVKSYGTDFSVTGAGISSGGTVTMATAPASGEKITLENVSPYTQETDIPEGGAFHSSVIEAAFDKVTKLIQQAKAIATRSFRIRLSDGASVNELQSAPVTVVGFDGSSQPRTYTPSELASFLNLVQQIYDRPMKTFADSGERAAAVPEFTGQLGTQRDDSTIWISTGTSAGNWSLFSVILSMFGSGLFTADATGRGKFASGFVNSTLLGDGSVEASKYADASLAESKLGYIGQLSHRNKVINGKMEICQRGTGLLPFSFSSVADNAYTIDRWNWNKNSTSGAVRITQDTDVPNGGEFKNSLYIYVTTADASVAAGDNCGIRQRVEGSFVRDLIGRTFTVSFWVRSTKTGTHCLAIRNSGSDRSYVGTYSVSSADTWEKKTVTITGGLITAGTWDWTTGIGISLHFTLMAGSTFQTTSGAWQTGNYLATSAQVNCMDTIGNVFAITGVQLEAGAATNFEHRMDELSRCMRYYQKPDALLGLGAVCLSAFSGNSTNAGNYTANTRLIVPMRTGPAMTLTHIVASGFPASAGTGVSSEFEFTETRTSNATTTGAYFQSSWEADAEL